MNFQLLASYVKFLLRSQNQHGLHSPFVYQLVTKCFYDKKKHAEYKVLKKYRKALLKNTTKIEVKDCGAGSRVFTSNRRKVSAIAKNAGIPKKRARLLFRIINYFEYEHLLELGTSLGLATSALALPKNAKVLSFEGCPQTANIAQEQLKAFGFKNVKVEIGLFEALLKNFKRKFSKENQERENFAPNENLLFTSAKKDTDLQKKLDFVYFDGNHQKKPTLSYFKELLPFTHNDTLFIFDDIHWSPGMEKAWEEIKKHPQVRVSIDCFYLGLVFFRAEQAKEHFNIRL